MAAAIPFVVAGMTVLNAVQTSRAQRAQGKHDRQVAYNNAKIAEAEGKQAMAAAASRGRATYQEGKLVESAALARGADSGITNAEMFTNYMGRLGAINRYNAELEVLAGKQQDQAKMHEGATLRWKGDAAYQQAKQAAKGTLISGVTSAMAGLYSAGAFGSGGQLVQSGPAKMTGDAASITGGEWSGMWKRRVGSSWQSSPF